MNKAYLLMATLLVSALALSCDQGFVPNPIRICIQPRYIEGCSLYLSETQCKTCGFRYNLQPNGLCQLEINSNEECCASRAGDGSCAACKTGLYMINGKCQQSNIIGCLQKDRLGICLNCATGYFLKAGSCQKTIKNCAEFSDQTRKNCVNCKKGFSLYNNNCVENSIVGCKKEVDHVCQECFPLFTLNNGHCIISQCKSYNDYSCVTCECGYYLTSQGNCKKMDTGCVRYQRGQCTDCLPNFKLKGNECLIEGCEEIKGLRCVKCSKGYEISKDGCAMQNCLSWKDGNCEACKQGFRKTSQGCEQNKLLISV